VNSRSLLFVVALGLAPGFVAFAQNTVSLQGTVVDMDTGKAIQGAVVLATMVTSSAAKGQVKGTAASGTATSRPDGGFQISSMPAGTYNVCVQAPRPGIRVGYLGSCHWGNAPASIAVAAGQKAAANVFKLKAGSVLRIHVDDSGKLLQQKNKDGSNPDLMMGVWSGGMFYPANVSIQGPTMTDYLLVVPHDTNLKFSIQSRHLLRG